MISFNLGGIPVKNQVSITTIVDLLCVCRSEKSAKKPDVCNLSV